jgi:hypothetical protein
MMVASTRRYLLLGAVVQGFIAWASAIFVAIFFWPIQVFVVDGGASGNQLHRTFEFVNANANPRLQQAPVTHLLCTSLVFTLFQISIKA